MADSPDSAGIDDDGRAAASRRVRVTARVAAHEHRLLKRAAAEAGVPLGTFVLDSARASAWRVLAGRAGTRMDDPDWERFVRLLDHPAGDADRLKALLADPA